MTSWNDPAREAGEALALIKSWHAFGGLYIWEFVLNLDYEYSIMMRRRPFMWTSLLFIGCRWCMLLGCYHSGSCEILRSFGANSLVILRVCAL
ncbi:hypothetical protein F5148DRAFT_224081 [Russula earlei]|uniref:Uncharacterized protein n=1 Tax=Russula earlei TaxID=71964 RepID=A0ACC0U440_9AGAM|nr:hypothetical protein F5148DRAFT_224081 [Russula earlei]